MSANRWKKLHSRKTYRERGQSEDRAHLGLLEKKKDYQQRARDFHRKQDAIHALEVKAAFRNPDEFFHKMIKTKKKDGKHVSLDADMEPTLAEKLDLQTSDIAYLSMKKQMEDRKIARMQGTLQMSRDKSPEELKSTHTVFVDTPEEAAEFEEAEHFDTAPEYMGRAFNRPTKKQLEEGDVLVTRGLSKRDIKRAERMRSLAYGELSARMKRSQQMQDTLERLELRRNLQKDSNVIKTKRAGKVTYKWRTQRKR